MEQFINYSPLDLPQISAAMFYPQQLWSPKPDGASDHLVDVEMGTQVSGRFYPLGHKSPSILFFHGNGEVACQYDSVAPFYNDAGVNIFVSDFRGYGRSGGKPSFSNMISDANAIFAYFQKFLISNHFIGPVFIKGRSLGCHSAVELAARHSAQVAGLIVESGASSIARMVQRWNIDPESAAVQELVSLHRGKLASISLPMLVIHGEVDEIIPLEAALGLCEAVSSKDITLEVIPNAGHNDLLWVGMEQYFSSLQKFISAVDKR